MTTSGPSAAATTHEQHTEVALAPSPGGSVSVVFWSTEGVRTVELPPGGRLTVGRSEPADVRFSDRSLSRIHAELRNDAGRVWIRDLDSRNGTTVGGRPIVGEVEVRLGDEVALTGVIAQVRAAMTEGGTLGVEPVSQLLARLDEEVVRARAFGRSLTLLMLRPADDLVARDRSWCSRLREALRPVDRMATYGARFALVMLPEVPFDEAERVASRLVMEVAPGRLLCGAASFKGSVLGYERLLAAVHDAALRASPCEPVCLAEGSGDHPVEPPGEMVIAAPAMKRLDALVRRAALTDAPVLILGETGVGKEHVALSLHRFGPRRDKPLRIVNCAALPAPLTESLLFGHERGAYTGAERRTKGLFEQAHGGTVFLDEVADLSPTAQASLLRVLESKRVSRVGSVDEIDVDVRVVAATHRDIDAMVVAGQFRQDLYYRLNTLTLVVPSLRDRREEILPLADLFLARAGRNWSTAATKIRPDTVDWLMDYGWPGNVRELRNVIERAAIVGVTSELLPDDLPESVRCRRASLPPPTEAPPAGVEDDDDDAREYRDRVRGVEAELIRSALAKCDGSRTAAAQLLKIPLRTLTTKIKSLGIKG